MSDLADRLKTPDSDEWHPTSEEFLVHLRFFMDAYANANPATLDAKAKELRADLLQLSRSAADNEELERLRWNLAGCLTIAESQKPTTFNEEMALPALHAVNKMAAELERRIAPPAAGPCDMDTYSAACRVLNDRTTGIDEIDAVMCAEYVKEAEEAKATPAAPTGVPEDVREAATRVLEFILRDFLLDGRDNPDVEKLARFILQLADPPART